MKKKKIFLYSAITLIALILIFLVLRFQIPATQKRVVVFAVWLGAEIYLWYRVVTTFNFFKNYKQKKRRIKLVEILISILYWMPAFLIAISFLTLARNSIHEINTTVYLTVMGASVIQYIIKFIIVCILIACDIFYSFYIFLKRKKGGIAPRWRTALLKCALCIYLIGLGLMGYGMLFVSESFQVRETTLSTSDPDLQENPLKIVLISDLHLATWRSQEPIQEVVNIINQLEPELLFITGDIVQFTSKELDPYMPILSQLKAQRGIYSVLGNHDYGTYARFDSEKERKADVERLVELQRKMGWTVLNNENVRIQRDGEEHDWVIAGIEFYCPTKLFINAGDIEQTYEGIQPDDRVLLLSHSPEIWDTIKKRNLPAVLTVSGHTHGMQIGYYGEKHRWSPAKILYKYWGGLYENPNKKASYLYVNVGLASIGFPARLGVYPEITVITLQ